MQRKIRVLVGKPGLDGHDRGAKVVAAALRDAGMEVIYTGLHQTPEQIVEAAAQEDVDVVALSILSGAHMTLFREVLELMRTRGIEDKLLTGGGIIPPEDMGTLAKLGVGRLFGPGASTQDIVVYIRSWFADRYGAAALAPLPSPPRATAMSLAPMTAAAHRAEHRPAAAAKAVRASKPSARAPGASRTATPARTARQARPSSSARPPGPKARSAARRAVTSGRRAGATTRRSRTAGRNTARAGGSSRRG